MTMRQRKRRIMHALRPTYAWCGLWLVRVRMHPTHELLPRRGVTA